jgi:hypothetical protein
VDFVTGPEDYYIKYCSFLDPPAFPLFHISFIGYYIYPHPEYLTGIHPLPSILF